MEVKSGIYSIKNILNNKTYVGSSINLKKRKREHFYQLRKGTHSNKHLQNAFSKYGETNFEFAVLERIEGKITNRETEWIKKLDSANREHGYNIAKKGGSCLGCVHGEEARRKNSARNNKTGYVGVSKLGNRYIAKIGYKGKTYRLGCFASAEEAAYEYNVVARGVMGISHDINYVERDYYKEIAEMLK